MRNNGVYTINHIHSSITQKAHYTSAKFDKNISEFVRATFTEEYIQGFSAPFVKECVVKIGLSFNEAIEIKSNGTIPIIGTVEHLIYPEEVIDDLGYMNLSKLNTVGIGGLNSYYNPVEHVSYPYARVNEIPDFEKSKSHLPQKICPICSRPFYWRKKWEKNWEDVRYCSKNAEDRKLFLK